MAVASDRLRTETMVCQDRLRTGVCQDRLRTETMVYQDRLRTGSGQQQHTAPALEWALQVPEWSRLCAWLAPEGAKPGASEPVISPCCYPAPPLPSSGKTTTPPPPLLLPPLSRAALTLTSRQLDRPCQSCLSKLDHRLHASQQRDRTLWVAVAGWISGGL